MVKILDNCFEIAKAIADVCFLILRYLEADN